MVSYDTFLGPHARVREADLASKGLLMLAKHPTPVSELFSPCFDASDKFYESRDDDRDHAEKNAIGGRIRQLLQLMMLQSHNVGDARSALVAKLLRVVKVNELLLTRTTEEQIADAANDAIIDEILASVDQEERHRIEVVVHQHQLQPVAPTLFMDAASKVRDRVLRKIPQVLPPPAVTLVWRRLDKVGDADLILRKTLQRIGVWGGGSQTPITTPYAPPSVKTSSDDGAATSSHESEMINQDFSELTSSSRRETPAPLSSCNSSSVFVLDEGQSSGVYVLSYAEGLSVVPARMLKYMRLLMHHEVSTNAFTVVVRFDPRPSHWELMKRGMVSPQSLLSSPTL
ncbi:unnamed protein product [Peronospora farinosa]|uniref:Uncharacterized protein n=1 Tax=Peronospora farinosa TaxID=134698 RepID=A0ABN8C3K5_9STRA|nr:unnamed protein product [Peronospora farinosa]